jgi:GNAT superfamily N-acetyltransferase
MHYVVEPATVEDAERIASLHAASWRSAYRGMYPDDFLDGPVNDDRARAWRARMRSPGADRRLVLKAVAGEAMVGLACVLLDAEPAWGALLDNLHVVPHLKGKGIGRRLFDDARRWVGTAAPGESMHLTVIERNHNARAFYDRLGGVVVERKIVEVVPGTPLMVLRYSWQPLITHGPRIDADTAG